jgi:hypothetical protein
VALIAQYRDSGLTQRVFAQREGIKFSTNAKQVADAITDITSAAQIVDKVLGFLLHLP